MTKFIDLFCGIGGFHSAITNVITNSKCVYACDIDLHARETYKINYGIQPDLDIKSVDVKKIPNFDMLCGGFPCQSFSVAQWKDDKGFDDPRGTLFFDILKIIDEHNPSIVLLENVANLARFDKGNALKKIVSSMINKGYFVAYEILNAKDFGIPQNRERIYIVATKNKCFDMSNLKQRCSSVVLQEILDDDIPNEAWFNQEQFTLLETTQIKSQPKSGLKFVGYVNGVLRKKGAIENTEHLSRVHRQINRIYSSSGTHPTLSASETSGRYCIYDERKKNVRKLTLNECYKLMSFPETFIKHANIGHAYHQIGNSVCVKVVESIIRELVRQEFL
jgi:DNA (cytosine-5)-methyltransferase 1